MDRLLTMLSLGVELSMFEKIIVFIILAVALLLAILLFKYVWKIFAVLIGLVLGLLGLLLLGLVTLWEKIKG